MTITVAPDHRLDALRLANEVRERRSALKAELHTREILLPEALFSDEPWVQKMRLHDLLLATPCIGRTKAKRILATCRLRSSTRLCALSPKGKASLIRTIAEMYPAVPLGAWREGR